MILAVMRASWTMLRRDRAALALSFVVPVVFFSIFALIFGTQRKSGTRKVLLIAVDEDRSERSMRLIELLGREAALELKTTAGVAAGAQPARAYVRSTAEAAVRAGEAPVALIVPAGFGAARIGFGPGDPVGSGGRRAELELISDSSDPIAPQIAAGILQKVAFTGMGDLFLASGIESLDQIAGFSDAQRERLAGLLDQVRSHPDRSAASTASGATTAQFAGQIAIVTRDLMGENKTNPLIAFYAAGTGVMFLLFTAAGAGGALIEERESGTLDRLLSTRISMTELLAGKLAYLTSLGVVQLLTMFVWGWLVFDLELPSHFGGFLLMAVPTALACSAFGLVLAAVCNTRKQLVAASNLVILSISALGGSMFPRFLMPEVLQRASLITFNSWALEGFLDVFWRDEALVAVLPEIGVLLLWSVGLFLVARRIGRRWEIV